MFHQFPENIFFQVSKRKKCIALLNHPLPLQEFKHHSHILYVRSCLKYLLITFAKSRKADRLFLDNYRGKSTSDILCPSSLMAYEERFIFPRLERLWLICMRNTVRFSHGQSPCHNLIFADSLQLLSSYLYTAGR